MTDEPAKLATWDTPENARAYRAHTLEHDEYREWSDRLVELAEIGPGMTVLDLGCGTGVTTDSLFRAQGDAIRILALDGSEAQLLEARRSSPSSAVEHLLSYAENLTTVVTVPIDRVLSNAAFWQMKPLETFRELSRVVARECRFAFNLFPTQLGRTGEELEWIYAPSLAGADLPAEKPPPQTTLSGTMRAVAHREFGYDTEDALSPDEGATIARREKYADQFARALDETGFEIALKEIFWVRTTPESEYSWYKIPIFRRNVFPNLDVETSGRILEAAYERWRPSARDRMTPMLNVVLIRKMDERSMSIVRTST
jgi:ubiquinone/menaquinone biosynthesis C-methylase UbiE